MNPNRIGRDPQQRVYDLIAQFNADEAVWREKMRRRMKELGSKMGTAPKKKRAAARKSATVIATK